MIDMTPEEVTKRILSERFRTSKQQEEAIMLNKMSKRRDIEDKLLTMAEACKYESL